MEWVETTGRSLEEAKEAALDQLGVHESDAEFVVLSEPKAGLFGRVRGEARVRARVMPTQPRPKRTRSGRHGQRRTQGQRTQSQTSNGTDGSGTSVAVVDGPEGAGESAPTGQPGGGGARRRRRRSRGGRGGTAGEAKRSGPSSESGSTGATSANSGSGRRADRGDQRPARAGDAKEETVVEELSLAEQGDSARAFVEGLVKEIGLDASVTSRVVDTDTATVEVTGDELGILIGPGGATLSALQELTRTYVQHRTAGKSERIMVDVAGYRARRAEALQRFTRQIAEEVLEAGTERQLEPMNPSDRKVVHDTVNAIEGVATRSEGEEPRRFIVISPTGDLSRDAADQGG
ncbi:MAG TPA: RNA-binding cell elongation regulator Jag/EloR [Acidimicrobiales bacterium]|nr:RNA-binding cell elongation regulator Jag/EloR [Acidimicrobiales bacterium]